MNRRRLVIVVVLAALFGAVLPYFISIVSVLSHVDMRMKERNREVGEHDQSFMLLESRGRTQEVLTSYCFGVPSDDEWSWLLAQHDKLLPRSVHALSAQNLLGKVSVYQFGFPFRAAYYGVVEVDRTAQGVPLIALGIAWRKSTYSALEWGSTKWTWLHWNSPANHPACLPLGIIWKGALGNIAVVVALFAGVYCGLAYLRARHRIKRGKCWKCGYLSNAAAVCPECGTQLV